MYYNECPYCGANLDPGEHCECEAERAIRRGISKRNYRNIIGYIEGVEDERDERFAVKSGTTAGSDSL